MSATVWCSENISHCTTVYVVCEAQCRSVLHSNANGFFEMLSYGTVCIILIASTLFNVIYVIIVCNASFKFQACTQEFKRFAIYGNLRNYFT